MTSNFFIVPTSPDYFSVMAIDSLSTVLPNWEAWVRKAHNLRILQDAVYPFPQTTPKFLGTIIQNYRPRSGNPATAFQNWIDAINNAVTTKLVPILRDNDMMLPDEVYTREGIAANFCLTTIPDFNSLIANSQEAQTPVFALTP